VRLDSKGRLLLPIEVRRSFGLCPGGAEVRLYFSLERNEIRIILNLNDKGGDL